MKIILIHGSVNYIAKPSIISTITKKLAKVIFKGTTQDYMSAFENYLKEKEYDVEQHQWSGSVSLEEIRNEGRKLHRKLKKEKEVLIVAKSNGGLIAQFSLLGLNHKLIQIATPNINPKTDLDIINIYSNTDKIQQAGIRFYGLMTGHIGSRKLYGDNVRNISMDGLRHVDFGKEQYYPIYEELIRKTIQEIKKTD